MDGLLSRGGMAAVVLVCWPAACLQAEVIASWDFNDRDMIVDFGTGTLTTNFPASDLTYSTGTTKNARGGIVAGQALLVENQAHNGLGRLDFTLDTRGHSGLAMSFAAQRSGTGFNSNQLAYSTDGGASFANFGGPFAVPTSAFDALAFDLSPLTALQDLPNAVIRITFAGATSATGNNRLDNVQFSASGSGSASVSAPEPPPLALSATLLVIAGLAYATSRLRANRLEDNFHAEGAAVVENVAFAVK